MRRPSAQYAADDLASPGIKLARAFRLPSNMRRIRAERCEPVHKALRKILASDAI
jgi:hypothetical protein